jgi:alpha-beta hydrolase superfamily lysophospholipase
MAIKHEESALTQRTLPGPALYAITTSPADPPRAVVGLLHGYADHGARYARVMDRWAEKGILTVAIDMRGHGRASGTRGYCARFEEFLDDAAELARLTADRANGAPQFLFGHSFGGLVAAMSVIETPRSWRGLVLSDPYFELAMQVPPAKILAGRVASRLIPKLSLPTGLKGVDVTHDPVKAREYDEDPLVFKNATARWFTETQRAQAQAFAKAGAITMPLYLVFGTEDPVAKMSAAKRFFDFTGSQDRTFDERHGLRHETLSEPEWQEVADAIAGWVLRHAKG